MDDATLPAPCRNLDQFISVLRLVLESQQHSHLHEAATFSQLLCINRRVRAAVLAAGVGRIKLSLTFDDLDLLIGHATTAAASASANSAAAEAARSLVQWIHQHLCLQTLHRVECAPELLTTPIWKRSGAMWWGTALDQRYPHVLAFLSRITTILAAAHAFLGPRTPVVERWFAKDISTATLSVFASQHLTQLVLTCQYCDDPLWDELSALTSLKDLRLPFLDCTESSKVGDALTALVQLTALLLSSPTLEVQRCIPASVQELVLAMPYTMDPQEALALKHLSSLTALHLLYVGNPSAPFEGHEGLHLQLTGELPDSLQLLALGASLPDETLMQASQLRVLQLLEFPHPMLNRCMALLQSTRLQQLTRLDVLQHPDAHLSFERLGSAFVQQMSSTTLPVHMQQLRVAVPLSAMDPSLISSCFEALASLTSLTLLELARTSPEEIMIRAQLVAAGILVSSKWNGKVQQLAVTLERLTNLEELRLSDIHLADSSGVDRAIGMAWLPVMEVIAGLPKLQSLHLHNLPLQGAVTALAPAQHLSRLYLHDCVLNMDTFTRTLSDLACKERLHDLFVVVNGWSREDLKTLLAAIGQHLTELRHLVAQTHWPFVVLLRHEYVDPLRNLKHLEGVRGKYCREL